MSSDERVVFIEYRDDKPFAVGTIRDGGTSPLYDAEWSRRDATLYLNEAGEGDFYLEGNAPYWIAEGYSVENLAARPGATRLAEPLPGFDPEDLLKEAEFSDCQFCPECDDWFPTEDTYQPCPHVFWCDTKGRWSTPGGRCGAECEDCTERGRPMEGPSAAGEE